MAPMGNINPAVAVFVAVGALCCGRALAVRSAVRSRFGELFWYASGIDSFAAAALLWASSEGTLVTQQRIVLGILGAVAGCLTLVQVGEWIRPAEGKNLVVAQAPTVTQGPGSAYSNNQQGGITAGTVNIGKLPRHLTPDQREIIINSLRGKRVSNLDVIFTTDPETAGYVQDIADAIHAAGIPFNSLRFGQIIGAYGISLYDPHGSASALADALTAAHINFSMATSRAGSDPYPPTTPALTIAPPGY